MVASINTEKAPGKTQHSFILKILKKLRIGKTDLQPTICEIRETTKQIHYCPFSVCLNYSTVRLGVTALAAREENRQIQTGK